MLDNQRRYFPFVSFVQTREKIVKLVALAKTARLKATVRELLGFLHRKAPLAAQTASRGGEEEGRGGLIASTRFPYAKPLYGARYEISGGPITARWRGAPSSRISGINSTLCDIQICYVEFFQSNEILPCSPFSPQLALFRTQPLSVPLSIREFSELASL